jgi:5-methylcytosine-specific restriction protein B
MAISTRPNAARIYDAAARFRSEVLRADGALFTPGTPVWTRTNLDDLYERMIGRPDVSGDKFEEKLERQLAGAAPAVIQLAAEALYVHLLIANDMRRETKVSVVRNTLALMPDPVPIPEDLERALDAGLASTGIAFKTYRPNQLAFLMDFVRAWKELTSQQQDQLLDDPWQFKDFLMTVPIKAAFAQRNALLHLVHPESFEDTVSKDYKRRIAQGFADVIDENPEDVDRALYAIRTQLEKDHGGQVEFYRPPFLERWNPPTVPVEEAAEPEALHRRGWLVRGANVVGRNLVPEWLAEGYCSIGWSEAGEIEPGTSRQELFGIVQEGYPDEPDGATRASVGNLARFLNDMSIGDLVVTPDGSDVYVGVVSSGPYWVADAYASPRRRDVDWINPETPIPRGDLPERAYSKLRTLLTVSEISEEIADFEALAGVTPEVAPPVPPTIELHLRRADEPLRTELHLPLAWLDEIVDLLEERRQIVFYGPPGTGKTYVAQKLAEHLIADGGTFTLVQFHPSYAYEDFFEGFRPRSAPDKSGALTFELAPGPLRRLAETAAGDPSHPYLLVIDELNRANLAKVFGELYFLLEYRDQAIQLQYSPEVEFTLPKNIYVIGTMNTADRSIALVDSAMRRRFYFVEFSPSGYPIDGLLRAWLDANSLPVEAAELLDILNARIDDEEFAVGPSYLMAKRAYEPGGFERVWARAILPLLEEHFFGSGMDVPAEFGLPALRAALASTEDVEEDSLE